MNGSAWQRIVIPSNEDFLKQWHLWIHKQVARKWFHNKDRIMDSVQKVRLRLLQKDFIGRWFFKHLQDEYLSKDQAEYMLGNVGFKFLSTVKPINRVVSRPDPNDPSNVIYETEPLWRLRDLLAYAKFDHQRFYYSIQNHTIGSDTVLRLLGYTGKKHATLVKGEFKFHPEAYNVLKSLYKQGRLKPAELSEHTCAQIVSIPEVVDGLCSFPGCGKKHFAQGYCSAHYGRHVVASCIACHEGKNTLKSHGVSLADDWAKNWEAAAALRWNDAQLKPFLREWRKQNMVKRAPKYIVRRPPKPGELHGVDAGLLKYARYIIDHEMVNDFKRIERTDDLSNGVFNKGVSSGIGDDNLIAWESDDSQEPQMVVKDKSSLDGFRSTETLSDLTSMIRQANLSEEEMDVILNVDLREVGIRAHAEATGVTISHVHKVRNAALAKMKNCEMLSGALLDKLAHQIGDKHSCSVDDMLGPSRVGSCVIARSEFFQKLSEMGLSTQEISMRTAVPEDRVNLALTRASLRN